MPDKPYMLKEEIKRLQGPILVLGAGGFVGANVFRAILSVRNDCYGVTHQQYVPWRLIDLPAENLLYADLTASKSLERIYERFAFRTIFDFAAYGAYARQDDVHLIYETNILGMASLLDIAMAKGFAAYVHAGSSSEYGTNSASPGEADPLMPNSHYAVSKVAASYLVHYLGSVKKLPVINLRYYSLYGPYEEPDRLVPTLVSNGLRKTFPVLVDPEISRDFVYIDDAVEAAILAATKGVVHSPGASLNIATGKKTTIRDLAGIMQTLCDIPEKPKWGTMPNRTWDLKNWFGNPLLAKKVLGWKPRTSLSEGLRRTIEWQRVRVALPATLHPLLNRTIRLSAVIACYRDGQAIPYMYRRLVEVFRSINVDYEIIFVNDASPDDSDDVLTSITAQDNHVIAIEHSRNFGSQSAFLSGMQVSTGDAVILFDGDLQDPPELVPKFFEQWRKGYDVVFGRRVKRETNSLMQFFYKAFYKFFREVSYVPIPLDAGDFSLMDRKVVDQLLALPETDQFLRGLRAWVGFKQTGSGLRASGTDVRTDDEQSSEERLVGKEGDFLIQLCSSGAHELSWDESDGHFLPGGDRAGHREVAVSGYSSRDHDDYRPDTLFRGGPDPGDLRPRGISHEDFRRDKEEAEVHPESDPPRRKAFYHSGGDGTLPPESGKIICVGLLPGRIHPLVAQRGGHP